MGIFKKFIAKQKSLKIENCSQGSDKEGKKTPHKDARFCRYTINFQNYYKSLEIQIIKMLSMEFSVNKAVDLNFEKGKFESVSTK